MQVLLLLIIIPGVVLIVVFTRKAYYAKRRRRLLEAPFPKEWMQILDANVALYRHLPPELKNQLHRNMNVFLGEKRFEGCGGLEITDEIRVTIAGEACLLLLNRKPHFYPRLTSILVYPHPYKAGTFRSIGRTYLEETSARSGESWNGGEVVLAWDDVKQSGLNREDGHNLVLHEFSHQLDQEDGTSNGAPILESSARYRSWAHVLGAEYEHLRDDVRRQKENILDAYGATNPAEFFAVATEAFFEKARQLQEKDPALYGELAGYYKVDPASWS